jgi:hypothetical protein
MKKIILGLMASVGLLGIVSAQDVVILKNEAGTGTPDVVNGTPGEFADSWDNSRHIYHVPQYMPGYPTAAVIFPRVVDVECEKSNAQIVCKGYHLMPEDGRGEYLMIHPVMKEEQKPILIGIPVPVPGPVREIEVERKKPKE